MLKSSFGNFQVGLCGNLLDIRLQTKGPSTFWKINSFHREFVSFSLLGQNALEEEGFVLTHNFRGFSTNSAGSKVETS